MKIMVGDLVIAKKPIEQHAIIFDVGTPMIVRHISPGTFNYYRLTTVPHPFWPTVHWCLGVDEGFIRRARPGEYDWDWINGKPGPDFYKQFASLGIALLPPAISDPTDSNAPQPQGGSSDDLETYEAANA